ncbi:hypothetical protein LENED_006815 [Lentinula edodes]|uniref:Uncharacterized protein n=1 Tax=Lentinula edodes TaxID=5353 RepID=A0A1Q3ECQ2_LENED|nr:hypothetical protein LENED_006815 [Lentinula edodes]
MNPEEQTLLSQAAANLYLEIWSIICTTVFYGIYLIAGIISIYLLIHPLPLTALLVAIFMTVDFAGPKGFYDFIVAWRAWAIWPTRRYVEVILVTVLVGSCVFRICDEVLYTLDICFPGHDSTRSILGVFNMLSLGFSIFTNIVSTFLLALKTWIYVATKRPFCFGWNLVYFLACFK